MVEATTIQNRRALVSMAGKLLTKQGSEEGNSSELWNHQQTVRAARDRAGLTEPSGRSCSSLAADLFLLNTSQVAQSVVNSDEKRVQMNRLLLGGRGGGRADGGKENLFCC